MSRNCDPNDKYVGNRIRYFRREKRLTQTELGLHLGVTFQQIQKYERGANRVGSGRLGRIAAFLGQPVASFFPPSGKEGKAELAVFTLQHSEQTLRLIHAFNAIEEGDLRLAIINLAEKIAGARIIMMGPKRKAEIAEEACAAP